LQFRERLERGDILFCAYWNGQFVGFVWLELPPVVDAGYALLEHEAYTHDGWTFEPYRGKRVLPAIQQAIFHYLRQNRSDIRNVVTHVATWNKASLAGDQRAGYRVTGHELSLIAFGYHWKIRL
jgi:RimJ/RimL family protein N-acetyltransferase